FTESLRQELDLEHCGVSALCVHPGGIRTNIANAAKMNNSLLALGMNPEKSARNFNKLLRCPPEEAARQILEAVQKDKRRLLIGNDAKAIDLIQRILPTGYQHVTALATQFGKRRKNLLKKLQNRPVKAGFFIAVIGSNFLQMRVLDTVML